MGIIIHQQRFLITTRPIPTIPLFDSTVKVWQDALLAWHASLIGDDGTSLHLLRRFCAWPTLSSLGCAVFLPHEQMHSDGFGNRVRTHVLLAFNLTLMKKKSESRPCTFHQFATRKDPLSWFHLDTPLLISVAHHALSVPTHHHPGLLPALLPLQRT